MRVLKLLAAALLPTMSSTSVQAAATCDQFKAAIVEGAKEYKAPAPKFQLDGSNLADADVRYFSIVMFDDVHAAMSCSHGWVGWFMADANKTTPTSTLDTMLLAGIGLHGWGMEWPPALETRDRLAREASAAETQTAKLSVDGGEASLDISVAGVPSFQIEIGP